MQRDSSVKCNEKIIVKNEMTPEEVKQKKGEKHEWLNLDIEGPNQETGRDSNLRLQNLDWSQPQQAKSGNESPTKFWLLKLMIFLGYTDLPYLAYVYLNFSSAEFSLTLFASCRQLA